MKKQVRNPRRLGLSMETVRTLNHSALSAAAGGDITSTTHPSVVCPSAHQVCLTTPAKTDL